MRISKLREPLLRHLEGPQRVLALTGAARINQVDGFSIALLSTFH